MAILCRQVLLRLIIDGTAMKFLIPPIAIPLIAGPALPIDPTSNWSGAALSWRSRLRSAWLHPCLGESHLHPLYVARRWHHTGIRGCHRFLHRGSGAFDGGCFLANHSALAGEVLVIDRHHQQPCVTPAGRSITPLIDTTASGEDWSEASYAPRSALARPVQGMMSILSRNPSSGKEKLTVCRSCRWIVILSSSPSAIVSGQVSPAAPVA